MNNLGSIKDPKLTTLEEAIQKRLSLKKANQTFVLTNGCFDLLHPGHIFFLQEAAKQGHVLWVLLNSDASAKALKGESRPVLKEQERAFALTALQAVGGITIFNSKRLTSEILSLKPDVYVKAGDYTLEALDANERTALEKVGAEIRFLPFLEGFSTTKLISKISKAANTF